MSNSTWISSLLRRSLGIRRRGKRKSVRRAHSRRPVVESLEDRTLPATWTAIGPAPILSSSQPPVKNDSVSGGAIVGVATDPKSADIVYVAAAGGGVWKTTNATSASPVWTPLTDNVTDGNGNPVPEFMGAIAETDDSNGNQIVYAGTGNANNTYNNYIFFDDNYYGEGVLVSRNGGSTWTLTNANGAFAGLAVSTIVIDPSDPTGATAYAAVCDNAPLGATGNTGIWKTTNFGQTWTNLTGGAGLSTTDDWSDFVIDPHTPTTLYAADGTFDLNTYEGTSGNGVYKSTDGGATWTMLTAAPNGTSIDRISMALYDDGTTDELFVVADALDPIMVKSTDGGSTFTTLLIDPNYLSGYAVDSMTLAIGPSDPNYIYAAGEGGSIESYDGGNTWTSTPNGAYVEPNDADYGVVFDANGNLIDGQQGGVFRLNDPTNSASQTWSDLNTNLQVGQIDGITVDTTNLAFASDQADGFEKYSGSPGWTDVYPNVGGSSQFDPTNQLLYVEAGIYVAVSANEGATWTNSAEVPGDYYGPPSPVALDASGNLYVGTNYVDYSSNQGASFSVIGTPGLNNFNPQDGLVQFIAVEPVADSNIVYAAVGDNVFVTENAQAGGSNVTWTETTLPAAITAPNALALDPADPTGGTVYAVTASGTDGAADGVFETKNFGQTWTNISSNLPPFHVDSVTVSPDGSTVYVGTDVGVYSTSNGGASWAPFGTGFPDTQVTELEFVAGQALLYAATAGRGVWEIPISANAPTITQQPANQTVPLGQAASFTAAASGNPAPMVQWQVSVGGGAFQNITGANSTTLTLTNVTAVMSGNQYQAFFMNSGGNATSNPATLTVAVPTSLKFTMQPSNTVSGSVIDSPGGVVVEVLDQNGNLVADNYQITVAANGPGGFTGGSTTTVTVTNGSTATFSNLALNTSGSYTLSASANLAGNAVSATSNSFQVTPSQVAISVQPPSTVQSGANFGVTVLAKNADGTTASTYGGSVMLSIASDTPQYSGEVGTAALGGMLTMNFSNGQAVFTNLTLNQLGAYTLQATAGTLSSSPSSGITVLANHLVFTMIPTGVQSSANFQVVVKAEDVLGNVDQSFGSNVTLTINSGPGGASIKLNGTTPVTVAASQGVATFNNVTLDKLGPYTLLASASPAQGMITGISGTIQVAGNPVIAVEPPSTLESGASFGLTVKVEDTTGTVDPNFQGLVTISIASDTPQYSGEIGTAALGGLVSTYAMNGVATFTNLNLNQLGSYTLQAAIGTVNSSPSSAITIVANRLVFTTVPTTVGSGANFQVVVSAEDVLGNVDHNFGSSTTLSIASGILGATLAVGSSTVAAGVVTFNNVTLDKLGTYTLLASSMPSQGTITGLSGNIQVIGNLVITTEPPGTVESGAAFGLTVKSEDTTGTVDPNFQGQVTISILSDTPQYSGEIGTAAVGGFVNVTAMSGVATFTNLNLNQLGSYTLQAASGTVTSSASSGVSIVANRLAFTTIPSSVQSATGFQVQVKAEDVLGNVDQSFGPTTSLSINNGPSGATLHVNGSTTVSAGVVTFNNVTLDKLGTYTLLASATPSQGTISGISSQIQVTANQLVFMAEPPGAVASGAAFGLVVQAEDSTGGVDPNFQGPVTLSIAADTQQYSGELGTAQLGGTVMSSNGNGVFSFSNLNLNQLGTYRLQASGSSLTSPQSTTITVSASQLVYTIAPPTSVSSGAGFQVQVKAEDALGNVDQNFGTVISLAIASGPSGAVLAQNGSSPVPAVVPSAGMATFGNLTLDLVGTYTLVVSANPPTGSLSKTSAQVTVTPLYAFVNGTPPTTVTSGTAFSVQFGAFQVIGGNYRPVTTVSGQVTLTATGPGGLRGTTTANFIGGVASFNNLFLDHFGSYTLTAAVAGGGPMVTSDTVTVTASSFKMISKTVVAAGTPAAVQFEALDDLGNVCTNFSGPVTVSVTKPFRGQVNGSLTPTLSNGVVTFSNLVFIGSGSYVFTLASGNSSGSGTVTVPGGIGI